jgi:3',5'-cyclic-AMP phosphodiesterase
MRVLDVDDQPFDTLPFLDASSRGIVERRELPFLRARVDALPDGLDAIVCTSDLQGREVPRGAPARLLGEAVAERLADLVPPDRTGVLLAGDLYTVPGADRRGGTGDVREVWRAFAERFRWVAGVAGNHDTFGDRRGFARRCDLLDGDVRAFDGLRVGGVSGIIGNTSKNERKREEEQVELLLRVLEGAPDVVVLHEGPDVPALGLVGHPAIREALAVGPGPLVVCGHSWWRPTLVTLDRGQALKVDGRVVVLQKDLRRA